MKRIVTVFALSLMSLLLNTHIASASTYNHQRGESACVFNLNNLQNHGYAENSTYTAEQIHALLKRSDIDAKNVDSLVAGQSYQLVYSCYVDHQLARVNLQALPVNNSAAVITNIFWTATKPA